MSERGLPNVESAAQLFEIQKYIRRHLPQFTQSNSDEFLTYNPSEDKLGRGQILWFYTENGREKTDPSLAFIFRPTGFVVNYYNSPDPEGAPRLRNKNNSLYGPFEKRFKPDELPFAIEKTLIHMNGFVKGDPEVMGQFVDIDGETGDPLTLTQVIERRQKELEGKSMAEQFSHLPPLDNAWALPTDQQSELAIRRISSKEHYTTFEGITRQTSDVIGEIKNGDEGPVLRELHLISAYTTLMRDQGILR